MFIKIQNNALINLDRITVIGMASAASGAKIIAWPHCPNPAERITVVEYDSSEITKYVFTEFLEELEFQGGDSVISYAFPSKEEAKAAYEDGRRETSDSQDMGEPVPSGSAD